MVGKQSHIVVIAFVPQFFHCSHCMLHFLFQLWKCWRACLMSAAILRFKLMWRKLLSLYTNSGVLKQAITLLRAVIIALPGHRSNNQPSARRRLSCWKWSALTCCHGRYGVGDGNIGSTRCCLTISHSLQFSMTCCTLQPSPGHKTDSHTLALEWTAIRYS